jgi:hypothetical protein
MMKPIEFFAERNLGLSEKLNTILTKALKDVDEDFYEGLVNEGYTEDKIAAHILNIDWDDHFVSQVLARAARYSKIWNFS